MIEKLRPQSDCQLTQSKVYQRDMNQIHSCFDHVEKAKTKEQSFLKTFNPLEWNISDFEVGRFIGKGGFGAVYLARVKKTKFVVALKIICKSDIIKNCSQENLERQIRYHLILNHENILRMYGYFWDDSRVYLILEYAENGDLFQEMSECKILSQLKAKEVVFQILKAVEHLKSKGIMHRDIKPENILKSGNIYKLCDFGWASSIDEKRETLCGTALYLAPQLVRKQKYSEAVDCWCMGILTFEILFGTVPFDSQNRSKLFQKILKNDVKFPEKAPVSKEARDFIQRLLVKNPSERINISEALKHSWFWKMDIENPQN